MRLNFIMLTILVSLLSTLVYAESDNAVNAKIDRVFTRSVDITGDGKLDEVKLYVKGKNILSPFNWNLQIISNQKIIFENKSDDKDYDVNFHDLKLFDDCNNYVECKKKYYFKDIVSLSVQKADLKKDNMAFDRKYEGSIYVFTRDILANQYHVDKNKISGIIDKMVDKLLSGKAWLVYRVNSPFYSDGPYMYVEEVKDFVYIFSS
jgi:hypothetical protein